MALKDLMNKRTAISEDLIERIVTGFVFYDDERHTVGLTPEGGTLGNKPKVLVYLTARLGLPMVFDAAEGIEISAKPSEIEEHTGIPGGSLRPLLKELLEAHVLEERDHKYSVRITSLAAIEQIVGGRSEPRRKSARRARVAPSQDAA